MYNILVVNEFILFIVPAVELADLLADLLGRMLGSKLSHSLEVYLASGRGHIQQEFLREGAILDIGEDLLHRLLGLLCDHLRSCDVIAVLSRVGDRISHACKT